jgi:hypothetical protein
MTIVLYLRRIASVLTSSIGLLSEGSSMFERRDLAGSWGGLWFAVGLSAGLLLAACTKSHDVDLTEQSLTGGSAAGSGVAGRGSTAGRGVAVGGAGRTGGAGRIGVAGTGAAGRIGVAGTGAAGRGAVAGRGGAAGGGTVLGCGTCAPANLFGFIMAAACCTSDNKCGLDLTSLGSAMCVQQNAAGTLDPNCPAGNVMGVMLQGCCRPDGTCGAMDTYLGLGCTAAASAQTVACKPK